MKLILTLLITLLLAPLRAAEPDWVLEGEAPWNARACQGECFFHDQLWILGGWLRSKEAPMQDVWSSSNGRDWKLVTKNAPWIHSDLPMSLAFNGQTPSLPWPQSAFPTVSRDPTQKANS